jgi:hypothetical protein
VAALLVTETVGSSGNATIAHIPIPEAPDLAVYAVWDAGRLRRVALLNLAHRNISQALSTAAVSVDMSGVMGEGMTVKRMTGAGMDSKDTDLSTWAGQSFTNGTASGDEDIEERKGDPMVLVRGSEGVVVFLH